MTKIILDNKTEQSENSNGQQKKETKTITNLFQGRMETNAGNAKFPDWDIVPPNQFINPRIKLK
jgi:hypothetical protein